jgi:hypothetical protein
MAHQGRPITAATCGAALHTLLSGERPPWVSARTWAHLHLARAALRQDALSALTGLRWRDRGPAIDSSLRSVQGWMRAGGWLGA